MTRLRRRLFLFLFVLCALAGGLLFFAPRLANLAPVRHYVAREIGAVLGRSVRIEGLEAGWTSGISVRGLRVGPRDPAQAGPSPLEIDTIRVENSLGELILGKGRRNVTLDGLRLRIEERAGGRTSIDDLLQRFTAPPPPGAPPRPRAPLPPLRITLKNASIELRHLPRRPQPAAFDPFRSDPVVRPADEGLTVIAIRPLELTLEHTGNATRVSLHATAGIDGRRSTWTAELQLVKGALKGRCTARGVDLHPLEAILGGELRGALDLDVEGDPESFRVRAKLRDFHSAGAGRPAMDEKSIACELDAQRFAKGYRAKSFRLESASGRLLVAGAGPLGLFDGPFQVQVRLPKQLVPGPVAGDVSLTAEGAVAGGRFDATGDLTLKGARLEGRPVAIQVEFDAGYVPGEQVVEIRRLHADTDPLQLTLAGTVPVANPFAATVHGSGRADLSALAPFFRLPPGGRVAGTARIDTFAIRGKGEAGVGVELRGALEGFRATGFASEELATEHSELHLRATVFQEGDRILVHKAHFDDLAVAGEVRGLRSGGITWAQGTVRGTLALRPLLARLAGTGAVTGLAGRAAIDATARMEKGLVAVEGSATIERLRVEGSFGRVRRETVTIDGSARGSGKLWNGDARLRSGGIDLKTSFRDSRPEMIRGTIADLGSLPLLRLPQDASLGGVLHFELDTAREAGLWRIGGTLDSPALKAIYHGHGLEGEPLQMELHLQEQPGGWAFEIPTGKLPVRGLIFAVQRGFYGRDGSFAAGLVLDGTLETIPELARYQAGGKAHLTAEVIRQGVWKVTAGGEAREVEAQFGARRLSGHRVSFSARGRRAPDGVRFDALRLAWDALEVQGTGTLGDRAEMQLQARGTLDELQRCAPGLGGSGDLLLDTHLSMPLAGAGRFEATGTLTTARFALLGTRLRDARAAYALSGRFQGADFPELHTTIVLSSGSLSRGNLQLTACRIQQTGQGDLLRAAGGRGFAFRIQARAKELSEGDIPFQGIELNLRGKLRNRLPEARRDLSVFGDFRFARGVVRDFVLRDGSARLRADARTAEITDLTAKLNEGAIRGKMSVDHAAQPPFWRLTVHTEGVRLTERLGRPLSLLVPILRLSRGRARRRIQGLLKADVSFTGRGTSGEVFRRALRGGGQVHLTRVSLEGSLLLPLLSGRIDRLLSGQDYTFEDVNISFKVAGGRVQPEPFRLTGKPFDMSVKGYADLDGRVNFLVQAGLLPFPMRVKGDIDHPKVRPAPLALLR